MKPQGRCPMGDRGKAQAIAAFIVLLLSLAFLWYGVKQHNETIDLFIGMAEENIDSSARTIRSRSLQHYEKRLDTFTQMHPKIVKAFAERDRERLYELTLPSFTILKNENVYFSNMHFHLPDGRSFLRMHDPDRWGDDLTEIRPSVKKIHQERKMISGFEVGVHGGFFRVLAPVVIAGEYVGAIEFAVDMHHSIAIVEEQMHTQATSCFLAEEWEKAVAFNKFPMVKRGRFVINSHGNPIYAKLPSDLPMDMEYHSRVEIEGSQYVVHVHRVFVDFDNRGVGGLFVLQDITQLVDNKRTFFVQLVLFTLLLLLLAGGALHFIFNRYFGAMSREIARRKEAENLYKESKTLLECMIDSIPDLIYYKDTSGRYLGCNTAFANMTGSSCDAIFGHSDAELFPPEQAAFFALHDQDTIDLKRSHNYEEWFGEEATSRYLHTLKTPYQGPDNELLGVIGISRDLSIYKQATEALKKAAQEWSAAMDVDADGICILDLDRHLLQANRAFYEAMQTDPDKALGLHIERIIHPQGEVVHCPVCLAQNELRDAHIVLEADHPGNPSGVPLETTVTIVRDDTGNPLSIFMRIHDLSAQRAVEDTLRRSKEEWERTFDALSDLVTIQDQDMCIVRANRAAEEFFQVGRGGLNGKKCHQVFRGTDTPCQDCPILKDTVQSKDHPPIIRHDNLNKLFHISSSSLLIGDGKEEYLVHVARDVTSQKELEDELFQAHKMEAVGTMAGGIAHDFNNILAAIIGFAEFVRDDLTEDSPSRADIEQVLQAADRAKELVRQILSFSRKSEHHLELLDPCHVVREVVKMLQATLPSTVTIEEELDENTGTIEADPTKIHQILVNLCTNAVQAMENEKGVLRISLQQQELHAADILAEDVVPGNYIVLQVSDTGQGMTQETSERIFDPFYSTKEVGKGTGLGLSVLHGIVKDYKGFVEVESAPGAGTTFRVYLPVVEQEIPGTACADKSIKKETLGGSEEILVVDDEPLLVRVNIRLLSNHGYKVTGCTSSKEALEEVRKAPERYDLLVTDQTMPELTGAELTAEVLKINPNIKVIMCTGHSSMVSEEDAFALGICRYVFKPIEGTELVDAIREVLDEQGRQAS